MLSIIIPSYNHSKPLQKAVQSALAQSCEKEIIVVDDGSKEPVQDNWDGQVRIIRHEKNKGLSAALNTGIAASKYDRFVILAADDELHPRYCDLMLDHIYKADIISCDFIGDIGRKQNCRPGSLDILMKSNCHSYAAIVKKSLWKKVGGFKEYMNPSWEDFEFWINCAKHGAKWHHVPYPLHIYHRAIAGRDVEAQGKDFLLWAKVHGAHQDLYGKGKGVVSFIIPCYDQEQYIAEAISSVKEQIYPHINIIVIDDGSPNRTEDVVKDAGFKDVLVIRQENKHLSAARNTGIKEALKRFNSEFLIVLDADDKISPNFVEKCLTYYQPKSYVYTDVRFFGDAWHEYKVPDYDCTTLTKKHLHACTFLMESQMWVDIVNQRGYGYDEDMKKGYEDWEFALAAVKAGYCGHRIPESLFYYRNHKNGSMRTEAEKINKELVKYIKSKQHWINSQGKITMTCATCGGRRYTYKVSNNNGVKVNLVNIKGIGDVDSREPIQVTYVGSQTSEKRVLGRGLPGQGSVVYRFSANPKATYGPTFNFIAGDYHLFANGPFKDFKRVQKIIEKEISYDDFTILPGVGPAVQNKMRDAGLSYYSDIEKINPVKLSHIMGFNKERTMAVINAVKEILEVRI